MHTITQIQSSTAVCCGRSVLLLGGGRGRGGGGRGGGHTFSHGVVLSLQSPFTSFMRLQKSLFRVVGGRRDKWMPIWSQSVKISPKVSHDAPGEDN